MESSGKIHPYKSTRLVSCGNGLIFYAFNMPMFMLWTGNVEGYISRIKALGSETCWNIHE